MNHPSSHSPMRLQPAEDGFAIDAADLGSLLDLPVEHVRREMRAGRIASRFERGMEEHAGMWRVTFIHGRERVRLTVDDAGRVLRRSRTSWSEPPGRAAASSGQDGRQA